MDEARNPEQVHNRPCYRAKILLWTTWDGSFMVVRLKLDHYYSTFTFTGNHGDIEHAMHYDPNENLATLY